jgi:hypothetical protein
MGALDPTHGHAVEAALAVDAPTDAMTDTAMVARANATTNGLLR